MRWINHRNVIIGLAVILVGLVAERATETMWCERADFASSGITNDEAPYLGAVIVRPRGLVQLVELDKLLPASVRDVLFRQVRAP